MKMLTGHESELNPFGGVVIREGHLEPKHDFRPLYQSIKIETCH